MMSFVLALPMPKIWALAFARVAEQDGLFFEFGTAAVGQDGDDLADEIGFGNLGCLCGNTAEKQPEEGRAEKFLHNLNSKKAFSRTNIGITGFYGNFFDNFSDRTGNKLLIIAEGTQ